MFKPLINAGEKFFPWLLDHMLGTYFSLGILLAAVGIVAAQSTYDVYNVPDMSLYRFINETQTDDIIVTWPYRNNVQYAFPGSGGVVLLTQGGKTEHIYFSDVVNNSTVKTFTLTGTVIRDLAWDDCSSYAGNGDGQQFTRTAKVQLVDDCRLFNFSTKKDRSNVLTQSGAISFSGSGSLTQPTFATTADRDRNLGASPQAGRTACVIATGLCYDALGGAWVARGANETPNATESVAGKVQIASTGAIVAQTATGATGAFDVLTSQYTTIIGGNTALYGLIPVVATGGTLSQSLIPQIGVNKLNGGTNATSSTFWRGDGTWSTVSLVHYAQTVFISTAIGSGTGASSTAQGWLNKNQTYTFPAGSLVSGNEYDIDAAIDLTWVTGTSQVIVQLGDSIGTVCDNVLTPAESNQGLVNIRLLGTGTASTSGSVMCMINYSQGRGSTNAKISADYNKRSNINTNSGQTLRLYHAFGTSNSGHSANILNYTITKKSSTAF